MKSLSLVSLVSLIVELGSVLLSAGTMSQLSEAIWFYKYRRRQEKQFRNDLELSSSSIAYSARAAITDNGLWFVFADDCDKLCAINPYSASALSFLEIFLMEDICSISTWLAGSLASEH